MKLKLNNIKNVLTGGLILFSCFAFYLNVDSFANSENIDLTDRSIVRSFGGLGIEYFRSVVETSDKGLVVVGGTTSTDEGLANESGDINAVIVKYDKYGGQQWAKSFGGLKNDYFESVVETSDKGFVAIGYSWSGDAGFDSKGGYDMVMVKYNSSGGQQWIKSFGGSDHEYFHSVIETSDKGLVAVGYSFSANAGFVHTGWADAVIIKYDSEGNQQWIESFGGYTTWEYFYSVIETSDRGLLVAGESYCGNRELENKGSGDVLVIKYDNKGNQQWVESFGGSEKETFKSVIETSDEGFIAVGYSDSANAGFENKGGSDAIIVKYDKDGSQEWIKNFGGSSTDYFNAVIETSDKGFMVAGQSDSTDAGFENKGSNDAIIVKYDNEGNQQWIKFLGGSGYDSFQSMVKTSDNGFVAVGSSYSYDAGFENKGGSDAIIVKYDKDVKKNESIFLNVNSLIDTTKEEYNRIRAEINAIDNEEVRRYLNEKLDKASVDLDGLDLKTASANLDIYIKSENMLSLSLNTNSVTFEEYSGAEPMEKLGAVNIAINSSLPYNLNAYMSTEISNTDGSEKMPIDILNIRESNEGIYKQFEDTTNKVILKENCAKGNNINHSIDLKLDSSDSHVADIYKTVIKFEAEQK